MGSSVFPFFAQAIPSISLIATGIKNSKPRAKQYKLADGNGLYLLVTSMGGKWWRYKYRFNRKEKLLALGTLPNITLKDARTLHEKYREILAKNFNPGRVKKTE